MFSVKLKFTKECVNLEPTVFSKILHLFITVAQVTKIEIPNITKQTTKLEFNDSGILIINNQTGRYELDLQVHDSQFH